MMQKRVSLKLVSIIKKLSVNWDNKDSWEK